MNQLARLLSSLGLNAVPAAGWFLGDWSAGTTLAVYWFENVAASLLIAARIFLHRRVAPKKGHWHYQPREGANRGAGGPYLGSFLQTSLIFSGAHGFFLAMFVFVLTANGHGAEIGLNGREVLGGCGLVSIFLVGDFLADLRGLRNRPFAWVERLADANLGRVVVVHLSIIFGVAAAAFTGANRSFFSAFLVLKTMADLASRLPQWNPETPPAWLCRVMERLPNVHPGETFEQFWVADKAKEIARREANEQPERR